MTTTHNERPIPFSAPMVRSLLDGTMMQTRRVVKHAEFGASDTFGYDWHFRDKRMLWQDQTNEQMLERCPHGVIGDQLWVRETWGVLYEQFINESHEPTFWRADYSDSDLAEQKAGTLWLPHWRPSIHMFRNRSRITLEITGVRVERLQDITAADALAEGVIQLPDGGYSLPDTRHYSDNPDESYASLWESINGAGSWDANPWVWVVEFKKVKP